MTTQFTLYLDGTLTTLSPFANSPAGSENKAKEKLLPRMPIYVGGAFRETPVIPASTFRGKIRRGAAMVLLDRYEAATGGEKPDFATYLMWSVGGVKGSGSEDTDVRQRHTVIEGNALLATFGAGDSPVGGMVGGRFHISPAIPDAEIQTAIVVGARAAENKSPRIMEFLAPETLDQVQEYTDANRARSRIGKELKLVKDEHKKHTKAIAVGKDADGSIAAGLGPLALRIATLESELKAAEERSKDAASDNSIGTVLPGYEVLPVGVTIPHSMVIKACTLEQIGFVLAALEEFAIDPVIGAHASSGCGRIAGRYEAKVRHGRERVVSLAGSLSFGELEGLVTEGDFLEKARDAWDALPFDPAAYRA